MSGVIIHRPEQPHPCQHPANGSEPHWTVWQCGCGQTWTAWPTSGIDPNMVRNIWMRDLNETGIR